MASWNHRHTLVLYMHIAGQRSGHIAEVLGYHPVRVSQILNSPLFQTRKAELLEELKGQTISHLIERIRREALPNFEFLVQLRDNAEDEKTALGAARSIASEADRVWPKQTAQSEERAVRLVVDDETLRRMALAMQQARGIDAELAEDADYRSLEDGDESAGMTTHEVTAADDFIREIEEAAVQESENDGLDGLD